MLRRLTALGLVAAAGLTGCSGRSPHRGATPRPLVVPEDLCVVAAPLVAQQTRWPTKPVEHATEGGDQPRATCRLEGGPAGQPIVVELEWVPTRTMADARDELTADCQIAVSSPVTSPSATHCELVMRNDKGLATGEVARADLAADVPGVLVAHVSATAKRFQPTAAGELRDLSAAILAAPELAS